MTYQHHLTAHAQQLALEQYLVRWGRLSYGACIRALEREQAHEDIAVRAHYLTLPSRVLAQLIQDAAQRIRFSMQELTRELTEEMTSLMTPPPGHARVLWLADVPVQPGEAPLDLVKRGQALTNRYEILHPAHPDGVLTVIQE